MKTVRPRRRGKKYVQPAFEVQAAFGRARRAPQVFCLQEFGRLRYRQAALQAGTTHGRAALPFFLRIAIRAPVRSPPTPKALLPPAGWVFRVQAAFAPHRGPAFGPPPVVAGCFRQRAPLMGRWRQWFQVGHRAPAIRLQAAFAPLVARAWQPAYSAAAPMPPAAAATRALRLPNRPLGRPDNAASHRYRRRDRHGGYHYRCPYRWAQSTPSAPHRILRHISPPAKTKPACRAAPPVKSQTKKSALLFL